MTASRFANQDRTKPVDTQGKKHGDSFENTYK